MNPKKLFYLVGIVGLAAAFAAPVSVIAGPPGDQPAPASQPAKATEKSAPKADKTKDTEKASGKSTDSGQVAAGATVAAFSLKDTDGKVHTLADLTKGKQALVIQWFNPDCPFVAKHYGKNNTFNDLNSKYGKDVQFVAICSNASGTQGSGNDRNVKAKKDWKIEYPILLDESGTVGKAFNAKNTPLMVVVTPDNKIAYYGAVDDDNTSAGPGKTNYVSKALDEIIAGKPVTTQNTKPYGCAVHYAD